MSTREWSVGYDEGYQKGWNDAMDEKPAEASEPVAYIEHHKAGDNLVWDKPGKNSSALYTTPPPVAEPHKRPSYVPKARRSDIKPLTDEEIWVLTSEYNDYDQHGEYFEAVFIGKPTSKQIQKHCHVTEQGAVHILNGGGRVKYEYQWYNLRKEKAAHGIYASTEQKK